MAVSGCVLETAILSEFSLARAAQTMPALNVPYTLGQLLKPSLGYTPPVLKGLHLNPQNPFEIGFVLDGNDAGHFSQDEALRLVKYFFTVVTTPEKDLWVNLSPVEQDRIMADNLAATDMGRDMLLQDYLLKQLASSLTFPEDELGKAFWEKVSIKIFEKYGDVNLPSNLVSKVWIVPESATVYASGNSALILDAKLDVMTERDYLVSQSSFSGHLSVEHVGASNDEGVTTNEIFKDIILPEIKREINEGQNFAPVRQMFHSLILGLWFKKNLKNNLINRIYGDRKVVGGIDIDDKNIKQRVYDNYLAAFKQGVYNFIQEDYDPQTQSVVPRQYFSGGMLFGGQSHRWLETTSTYHSFHGPALAEPAMLSVQLLPSNEAEKRYDSLNRGVSLISKMVWIGLFVLVSACASLKNPAVSFQKNLKNPNLNVAVDTAKLRVKPSIDRQSLIEALEQAIRDQSKNDNAQLSVFRNFFVSLLMVFTFLQAQTAFSQSTVVPFSTSDKIELKLNYGAGVKTLHMTTEQQKAFADLKNYVSQEDVVGLNGKIHPGGTTYNIDTNYIKKNWDKIFTSSDYTWAQEAVEIANKYKVQALHIGSVNEQSRQNIGSALTKTLSADYQNVQGADLQGSGGAGGGSGAGAGRIIRNTSTSAAAGIAGIQSQTDDKKSGASLASVNIVTDSTLKDKVNPNFDLSKPNVLLVKNSGTRFYKIDKISDLTKQAARLNQPRAPDSSGFEKRLAAFTPNWKKWGPQITIAPANFMVFEAFEDSKRGDSLFWSWKPNTIMRTSVALANGALKLNFGQKPDDGVRYLRENIGKDNQKQPMHQTFSAELDPLKLSFWNKKWLPKWWQGTSLLYNQYGYNFADARGQKSFGTLFYDPQNATGIAWKNKFRFAVDAKNPDKSQQNLDVGADFGFYQRWMKVENQNRHVGAGLMNLQFDWGKFYSTSQLGLIYNYSDKGPFFVRTSVVGFKLPNVYFYADRKLEEKNRRAVSTKASVFAGWNWGNQSVDGADVNIGKLMNDVTRVTIIADRPGEGVIGMDALILQALRLRVTTGFDWKGGMSKEAKLDIRHVVVSLSFTGDGLSQFSEKFFVPVVYADNNIVAIGKTVHSWGTQSVGLKTMGLPIWMGVQSNYIFKGDRKAGTKLELTGGLTHLALVVGTTGQGLQMSYGVVFQGQVLVNKNQGIAGQGSLSRRFGKDGHAMGGEVRYAKVFTGNNDRGYRASGIMGVEILGEHKVAPWLTLRGNVGAYRMGENWYGAGRGAFDFGKNSLYAQGNPTNPAFQSTGLYNPSAVNVGFEQELKFGTGRIYAGWNKGEAPAYGVGLTWNVLGEKPQPKPTLILPVKDIVEAKQLETLPADMVVADLDSLGIRSLNNLRVDSLHVLDRVYVQWETTKDGKPATVHQMGFVKAILTSANGPVSVQFVPTHTSDHTFKTNGAYVSFDAENKGASITALKPYGMKGTIAGVEITDRPIQTLSQAVASDVLNLAVASNLKIDGNKNVKGDTLTAEVLPKTVDHSVSDVPSQKSLTVTTSVVSAKAVNTAKIATQSEKKTAAEIWAAAQQDANGASVSSTDQRTRGPNENEEEGYTDVSEAVQIDTVNTTAIAGVANPFDIVSETSAETQQQQQLAQSQQKNQEMLATANKKTAIWWIMTMISFLGTAFFVTSKTGKVQKYRRQFLSVLDLENFTTELLKEKDASFALFTGAAVPMQWTKSQARVGRVMAQPFPIIGEIEEHDGRMELHLIFQPDDARNKWNLSEVQAQRLPSVFQAGVMTVSVGEENLNLKPDASTAGSHFVKLVFDLPSGIPQPQSITIQRPAFLDDLNGKKVSHEIPVGMSDMDKLYYQGELLREEGESGAAKIDYDGKVQEHFREYYQLLNLKHRNIFEDYGYTAELADKVLRQAGDFLVLDATKDGESLFSEKTREILQEFVALMRPLYEVVSKNLGSIDAQKRMYFERGDTPHHKVRSWFGPLFENVSLTAFWVSIYKKAILQVLPDIGFHKRRLDVMFGQEPDSQFTMNRLKSGFFTLLNWWQDPNVRSMGGLDAASRINRIVMDGMSIFMITVGLMYAQDLSWTGTLYVLGTFLAARVLFPLANILTIPMPFSKGFYSLIQAIRGGMNQQRVSIDQMKTQDSDLFDDEAMDRLLSKYSQIGATEFLHSIRVQPKKIGFEVSLRSTGRIGKSQQDEMYRALLADLESGTLILGGVNPKDIQIKVHSFGVNMILPYTNVLSKKASKVTIQLRNDQSFKVNVERDALTHLMDALNELDEALNTGKIPDDFDYFKRAIRNFYDKEVQDSLKRHHFRNNLAAYRKLRGKVDHIRVKLNTLSLVQGNEKGLKMVNVLALMSRHTYEVIRFYGEMATADVEKRLGYFRGKFYKLLRTFTFVKYFVERAVSEAYVAAENAEHVGANPKFAKHLIEINQKFDRKLMRPSPHIMLGEQSWRTWRRYWMMSVALLVAGVSLHGLVEGMFALTQGQWQWYGLNLGSIGGFYVLRTYFAIPLSGVYWVLKEYRQSLKGFLKNRVIAGRSASWVVAFEDWMELIGYSVAIVLPWAFPVMAFLQYSRYRLIDNKIEQLSPNKIVDDAQLSASKQDIQSQTLGNSVKTGGIDFGKNLDNIKIIDGNNGMDPVQMESAPVINLQHFQQFRFKILGFKRMNENEALAQLGIESQPTRVSYNVQPAFAGM